MLDNMKINGNDVQTIHKSMSDGEDTPAVRSSTSPKFKSHIIKRQKYNRTTNEANEEVLASKHRKLRKSPGLNKTYTGSR